MNHNFRGLIKKNNDEENDKKNNKQEDGKKTINNVFPNEPEETKRKLLEIAKQANIRPNDPMYLSLAILSHARLAITPIPEKLEEIQRNLILSNTRIEQNLMRLNELTETFNSNFEETDNPSNFKPSLSKTQVWDIAFRAAFAGTICGAVVLSALLKLTL